MKRPLKNLLSLGFGDAGSRFLGFLVTVYLARVLEPSGFGVMNIGLAVLGYLGLAASPGIQILEVRNVAKLAGLDAERVGAVVSFRLTLALLLWSVTIATAHLVIEQELIRNIVILFAASLVPLAFMLDWFFQGKEDFVSVGVAKLVNYVVYGLLVLALVQGKEGLLMAAAAFGAGNVAGAAMLWVVYRRRFGSVKMQWSLAVWKEIATAGIPLGMAMFLAQSATNLPPLVIGVVVGTGDVGVYSAAMKLVFFLLLIDRLLSALFLPVVSRYFVTRSGEVPLLAEMTVKIIIVASLPIVVIGIILAPTAIILVFGGSYEGAIPVLRILLGFFSFTLLNSVYMGILIGAGREKEYARNAMVGALLLAFLIIVMTAVAGTHGAAFGVAAGEFVILMLMMRASSVSVRVRLGPALVKPLTAGVVMAVVAYLSNDAGVLANCTLAFVAYVAALALLRGITRDELQFLRERFV